MKNKKIIKKMMERDKKLINMLIKTRVCSVEQAKSYISKNRINQLKESGIIDVVCGRYGRVVILKEKGHLLGDISKGIYRGVSTKHDMGLANEYMKMTEEERNNLWAGEYWCRENGYEVCNSPDIVLELDNEVTYIEIITKNYTMESILQKELHSMSTNSKIRFIKV